MYINGIENKRSNMQKRSDKYCILVLWYITFPAVAFTKSFQTKSYINKVSIAYHPYNCMSVYLVSSFLFFFIYTIHK